jgi:NAD(P)-dependent dehydrogenase (short-subunit alcohol dehydrogenase family)
MPKSNVALVTGAGSGIGRATAIAFLKAGYKVVLAGRRIEPLEETAAISGAKSAQVLVVSCDVTSPESVGRLFERCRERFGRLDVLFNNAGVTRGGSIEEISFDDWTATVATNLTGPFLCTQAAFRLMKSQVPRGGRIINNGSLSAQVPRPESAPYTATKHAITGLTKTTSIDGRQYDIACGQIDVGNALTEIAREMIKRSRVGGAYASEEPVMDVEHVASSIIHMASLPLDSNVLFMTVMATKMPFVGRG